MRESIVKIEEENPLEISNIQPTEMLNEDVIDESVFDEENLDEIDEEETQASEDTTESSETLEANFAEVNNASTDISADLRSGTLTESARLNPQQNDRVDEIVSEDTNQDSTISLVKGTPEVEVDIERIWIPETSNETIDTLEIGTFNHESAEVSDWGDLVDGKAVFTQGDITVTTSVSDGTLRAYNSHGNHVGSGIGNNDNKGLDKTETLTVEIDGANANRVDFKLDGLGSYFDENSRHATEVKITAYDTDGNVIDVQGGYRNSAKYEDIYSFETDVAVSKFEITSEGSKGNFVIQNMTLSATDSIVVPGHWESVNEVEGLETLRIDGTTNIDFSALDNNISNIEAVDLGTGSQKITSLLVEDVLNVTDTDNILRIDGDSSDSIDLHTPDDTAQWTLGDFKVDVQTGTTYQEVTGELDGKNVMLEVNIDITIDQS